MKLGLLVLAALTCVACSDTVQVLGTDDKFLGYCSETWVKCIHDFCPNGFDIPKEVPVAGQGIVRCK